MDASVRKLAIIGLTALVLADPGRAREAAAADGMRRVGGPSVRVARRLPLGAVCIRFASPFAALPDRWGDAVPATVEPPLSVCGDDGASLELAPAEVAVVEGTSVRVASLEDARPRRGAVRTLDVSFLVPASSIDTWNHVGAFVSFDDSDERFRRIGAAAFASTLFVELVDAECSPEDHLLGGVAIPGGIRADHWYRLYADLDATGPERSIGVLLVDLETLAVVAETGLSTACPLGWAGHAKTSVAFLAAVPPPGDAALPRMLLDDYFASARGGAAARTRAWARAGR